MSVALTIFKNEGQYLRGVAERMLISSFYKKLTQKKTQKHNGEMNGVGKLFLLMGAQTQEASPF